MTNDTASISLPLPPVAAGSRLFGNMRDMQDAPMRTMAAMQQQYGDVVGMSILGNTSYFVFHPDGIQKILLDNHRNYHKQTFNYQILYPLVGMGLLTSDGDFWMRQRRLAQPAFHRRRIEHFAKLMVAEAQALCGRWETAAQQNTPLNIEKEMAVLTLNIVGKALLSLNMQTAALEFSQAFMDVNNTFGFQNLFSIMFPWLPTPTNRLRKRAIKTMDQFVYRIIRTRRSLPPDERPQDDLLALLMAAVDEETGETMTDQQLRDEVITILLAGHETTAIGLTWVWYFLSQNPPIWEKLQAELNTVLNGRLPAIDDFPQLQYTLWVFKEALRFYPPAWTVARGNFEADTICGYNIPPGSILQINLHLLHHDPRYWEAPDVFDPERFSPDRSAKRHKMAYLPFITGPRKCIGDQFALTEAVLALATIAQKFRPHLQSGYQAETQILITQRPKHEMIMTLEKL